MITRELKIMKKFILAPSILALFVATAAHAGQTFDTAAGSLYLGGDVEFDLTGDNAESVVNRDNNNHNIDSQTLGGRLLIDIHGERILDNGVFASFAVAPTYSPNGGDNGVDDAKFAFGVMNDWSLTLGHFEAADFNPAGQDTVVVGNDIYRGNDARGRLSNGEAGQIMYKKSMGAVGFELTTVFGANEESIDPDDASNPDNVFKNKDAVVLRPALTWYNDTISAIVGAEVNVINDANEDAAGEDLTDWIGYGASTTIKANDALSITLNAAFKDNNYKDQDELGLGIGAQYYNFYAHYQYGTTDNVDGADVDLEENVGYVSYKIPAVMDLDNFDIFLGASYGETKVDGEDTVDNLAGRVRFKYIF